MTTDEHVFRVPKRKTSVDYDLEIKKLMERVSEQVQEQKPTTEPTTTERDISHFRELFDEDDLHFAMKFQARQIFLGNQQVPSKSASEFNVHVVVDTEPRVMINIAVNYVTIPMTEIMAIAVYKSNRLGFNHVMIMNLTSRGSSQIIEKQPSLKYRLNNYQEEGMSEDDLAIQRNTLFMVLPPHDSSKMTKLGILSWLKNPDRSFQIIEGATVKLLKMMKDKVERNCYVIEIIVEQLGNDEIDEIMETMGLSWLKTANGWQIRDRCHFLNMVPTLFMECTTHGVCELTEPDHPDRRASVMNSQSTSEPTTSESPPASEEIQPTLEVLTAPEPEQIVSQHKEEEEPAYTVTYVDVKCETPISSILASLIAEESST
uniref:Uncharacterized protein n=1 Tax=Caenorhabditis tropicalis TaxID=1561998 RepID=A0A1I7U7K9_9PELO